MSISEASLQLADLYEAELLIELMLRYWNHPFCEDDEFRNSLLETAIEVLKEAAKGTPLIDSLPPASMNLVAAVWYAECNSLAAHSEASNIALAAREEWLMAVKQSLPACFCDPENLC